MSFDFGSLSNIVQVVLAIGGVCVGWFLLRIRAEFASKAELAKVSDAQALLERRMLTIEAQASVGATRDQVSDVKLSLERLVGGLSTHEAKLTGVEARLTDLVEPLDERLTRIEHLLMNRSK